MNEVIASMRSFELMYIVFQSATKSRPSSTLMVSLVARTALVPSTARGELAAISSAIWRASV